ncbi:enoyl-CoA hydratase-related protein, partial [Pseudomonadales bacterium]|nr:enoyl-CoA hydratase-related protein [Pseudomonadales bacterium]
MKQLVLETTKILAEVSEGIGWLTFNQPERRNAISLEMWQGIGDAMEMMEADADVRVVIMKGAGGKA